MAMNPNDLKGKRGERIVSHANATKGAHMSGANWHEKRRAAREATDTGYQALAAALGMATKGRT